MLQPLQLQELLDRYPAQIAELREFFTRAGIAAGSSAALAQVNQRARQDRSFSRDLTSHLWVLVEEEGAGASALLGIVTLAAAGPESAAEIPNEDAHALLRYVMDARRAFGRAADTPAPVATPKHTEDRSEFHLPGAVVQAPMHANAVPGGSVQLQPRSTATEPDRRGRSLWIASVCVLLALLAGAWFWIRTTQPPTQSTTRPQTGLAAPRAVVPSPAAVPPLTGGGREPVVASVHPSIAPVPRATSRPSTNSFSPSIVSHSPSSAISTSGREMPGTPLSMASPTAAPTTTAKASTPLIARMTATGTTLPVPAAVLSKRLDSPRVPSYAPVEDETVTRRHPRLLRRPTAAAGTLREENDEIAEAGPGDAPVVSPARRNTAPAALSRTGTVRPVALGMMAANVLYSPAPQYPAAANAANVQGEVRVQARIDPSGNVASARVISGPPLLRDAALEAVQHWRYRPWMASGRPTATSTVAVVDFELQ